MKISRTWWVALLAGALLGLAGCNTISFFPGKAAERAVDKVLDDMLPSNGSPPDAALPPERKQS